MSGRRVVRVAATPMLQRLVQLTAMLSAAGDTGWRALELADALGYGGLAESRREALARDIRGLRRIGVEIDNVAEEGSESRWVLRPRDSRVQLEFPPEELSELSRAAVLAGRESLPQVWGGTAPAGRDPLQLDTEPPPPHLDAVIRAVSARCRLDFTYNGRPREVDPASLSSDSNGWSLTGFDHSRGEVRTFSLRRMSHVRLAPPGSAGSDRRPARTSTDPLRWEVDPPLTAQLRAPREFAPDLAALLAAAAAPDGGTAGDTVRMTATVTNRLVFLARLLELGTRVELLGPPELRTQFEESFLRPEGLREGPA